MIPKEAVLEILGRAEEPLHWTVVQDRALREGLLDPFALGDVRSAVLIALRELAAEGAVMKTAKGVYAIADPQGR